MQANSKDQQKIERHLTCPNLGLRDDPATISAFPSQINACYHVEPFATPKLSHQHAYCLHSNHTICPVFKAPAGGKMPKEIIHETRGLAKKTRHQLIGVGALLIVAIVILWLSFGDQAVFPAIEESSPTATERVFTPVTNPQMTATQKLPQPTPSPTALSPTVTVPPATPTEEDPILALEPPSGMSFNSSSTVCKRVRLYPSSQTNITPLLRRFQPSIIT